MRSVYMDNGNTTPLNPDVFEAMRPYFVEHFGNPASIHAYGQAPREALDKARGQVAALIGSGKDEVLFTSCGTESNNFAVKGIAAAMKKKGRHIITTRIEHFSVLYSCKWLEKQGFEVTYLPVGPDGVLDPAQVKGALRDDTVLITVMHANHEMGAVQPIAEIGRIAAAAGVPLHTDAVASAGSIPLNVSTMGVSAMSLAANMFNGPKGVGALYVKKGARILPMFDGGVQEGGRRAGTENLPAIVGMGKAAEIALGDLSAESARITGMRDRLAAGLLEKIGYARHNGHPTTRLPGNVNISFEFVEGESVLLFLNMQGVAASSGSACTSKALKASHVLTAIGVPAEICHGSIVFTLGRMTTDEDVDYVLEIMPGIIQRLRDMSPLYEDLIKSRKAGG